MLVKSYYGPGTSLFYPMAPAAAAAGIPLTAASPFANANAVGGAGLHAQNLAAAAAAAAAAQQQQNAVLSSAQYQFTASQGALKSSQVASTVSSSSLVSATPVASSNSGSKLGSPAAKKFRPAFARPSHKGSRYIPKPIPQELGNLKTYSSPDILICGNCREMFNDLVDMLEHKRDYCKLRFTCKCDTLNDEIDASCTECNPQPQNTTEELGSSSTSTSGSAMMTSTTTSTSSSSGKASRPKWLHCVSCKSPFGNAWDLMVHVQTAHMMNIYQLADTTKLQNASQQRQRSSVSPSSLSALSTSSALSSPTNNNNSADSIPMLPPNEEK